MVVMLPLFLAFVGLVFDGGVLYVQFRRARWAADAAAIAAASDIVPGLFQERGEVQLGPQAQATAQIYARQNYPDLRVTHVVVLDNMIHVRGQVYVEPMFLSMFGVQDILLHVEGQGRPAWGATQEGE